jgi:hypothetical protein
MAQSQTGYKLLCVGGPLDRTRVQRATLDRYFTYTEREEVSNEDTNEIFVSMKEHTYTLIQLFNNGATVMFYALSTVTDSQAIKMMMEAYAK